MFFIDKELAIAHVIKILLEPCLEPTYFLAPMNMNEITHKNDKSRPSSRVCLGAVILITSLILLSNSDFKPNSSKIITKLESSQKFAEHENKEGNENENENETIDRTKWIIIGFSDTDYVPIAKIWYTQLKNLGYSAFKNVCPTSVWSFMRYFE